MNIKRFFGKNSREALNQVRSALGENAIIISNRSVNGGNEIMAVSDHEVAAATASPFSTNLSNTSDTVRPSETSSNTTNNNALKSEPLSQTAIEDDATINFDNAPTLLSILTQNKSNQHSSLSDIDIIKEPISTVDVSKDTTESLFQYQAKDNTELISASNELASFMQQELNEKINEMLKEMRGMRSNVESQINAMSWNNQLQNNPVKSKIISTLLAAKFSVALSRKIAEKLPTDLNTSHAHAWVKDVLARHIDIVENEDRLFEQGGVYALIGPTGVGKTTTTAKLAARYVMKHGTQSLGLITTDGYRIGGHEQLRIYGKILGVMVHAVKDEDDLKMALQELKNKKMILIDTVGISQRDQMVTEQIAMLSNTNTPIQKLLCLNATSTGETLTDVIRAYKDKALDGCIITKLDEAASSGGVLDVIIREKIKLYYTTHGQRVPEDIAIADREDLINKAFTLDSNSWAYQYLDEELPFIIANVTQMTSDTEETSHA